jgi:4-amino-4-deoxy-L-arabinose transferase-like glycosyltransferase
MERGNEKFGRVMLVLFLASLVVRLLFAFLVIGAGAPPIDDAVTYDNIAMNLVRDQTFIQTTSDIPYYSLRPPLLPFFLAGVYSLTGHSFAASRIFMIILGSLIAPALFAMTARIFGRRAALVSGWIAVFYPFFILYANVLLTETLSVLFVCIMVLLLMRFVQERKTADICLAGVAAGLGCLARPPLLMLLPVTFIWLLIVMRKECGPALRACVLFSLLAVVVISPWTYRNYSVHGELMPITSLGGLTLWYGNSELATGNLGDDYSRMTREMPDPGTISETEINRYFRRIALDYMRDNPKRTVVLGVNKCAHFWRPSGFRIPGLIEKTPGWLRFALGFFTYMPLLLLFLYELIVRLRDRTLMRNSGVLLIFLYIAVFTIMHCVFPSVPRYRAPIMPLVIALAGSAVVRLWDRLQSGAKQSTPSPS